MATIPSALARLCGTAAAFVLLSCGGAGAVHGGDGGGLEVKKDGTARVVGTVVENRRDCEVDAICRLLVDAGGRRVTVIYHGGEGDPCVNTEAVRQGFALKPGNRVEAYGAYQESGPTISTCPSESYFLRRVEG